MMINYCCREQKSNFLGTSKGKDLKIWRWKESISGNFPQVFCGKHCKFYVFQHAVILKAHAGLKSWILSNFWFCYKLGLLANKYSFNRNDALFLVGFVPGWLDILLWSWFWISACYYDFQILDNVVKRE